MVSIRRISGHYRSLYRVTRLRSLSASYSASASNSSPEEYSKRNYANNISEYNTVLGSLIAQRRHFLVRDVYDDMLLDGVQPVRDTFHSLIIGSMKGGRLQDAFFFRDEMKALGLVPDVALYNFLISTCGKCKNCDPAIHLLEEMKRSGVKPNGQTYICLLNACAASGRIDRVYAIVRDMTAAGLGLNKFCYAGLISAYKNKPSTNAADETTTKIIELVKQSKGWSSVEASSDIAENVMMGVSEEELYNIPTAELVNRRAFLIRQLTVYHVAFHACADLKSIEMLETLANMLKQDGYSPDVFIVMQVIRCCEALLAASDRKPMLVVSLKKYGIEVVLNHRGLGRFVHVLEQDFTMLGDYHAWCYLHCGDIDRAVKTFEDYVGSGKPPIMELYATLAEGAMVGYTPKGMQLAQETLEKMNSRGFFLNGKMGNELLLAASGEKTGGYTTANYIWDLMQSRKINPSLPVVDAYYRGLKGREIPADDPRLQLVARTLGNLQSRFGGGRSP